MDRKKLELLNADIRLRRYQIERAAFYQLARYIIASVLLLSAIGGGALFLRNGGLEAVTGNSHTSTLKK